MNQEEALKVLGLAAGATADDIKSAATQKKDDIQSKITSAPTDALKTKFQQLLDKLISAEQSLTQPAKSRSPLSETKMADLPGMAPVAADSSAQSLQPGDTLSHGRYQIKERIGEGGMGAVYHAFDTTRSEDIAIKVLLPGMVASQRAKDRFLDEARISSKLSHPNIVNVFDVQEDGDKMFLTMELLDGQDLRALMENRKLTRQPFDEAEAKALAATLCDALDYAHQHTIHRDIKPENIWVSEDGQYKLMDFGIARVMSNTDRTQTGVALGTAYYMAPEQLKGTSNIDGRADQYALGVLLYELLSGDVPAGRIKALKEVRKDLSKGFAAAIDKTLEPDPGERFSDMASFNKALNAKGSSMPALPVKAMGIVASIVAAIVLLVVLGSSGALSNLSDLLPQSAEELAAQKAVSIQLQGEVETLKRRLESRQRDLKQQLRDAERNKDKNLWQLEDWQNLTENHIFESSRYAKLNGLEKLSESQVKDKEFALAEKTLNRVKTEYEELLGLFSAAEQLPAISRQVKQVKAKWEDYVAKGHGQSSEAQAAEQVYDTANTQRSQGELKQAQASYEQSIKDYAVLNKAGAERLAQAEAAARSKREAAAQAKAAANRKAAAAEKAKQIKKLVKSLGLVTIPAGSYRMGSNDGSSVEEPVHRVNIKAFKLMSKEVTFAQYDIYAKATGKKLPSDQGWDRGNRPVINVIWQDAKDFANWLSKQTGKRFRLPSEAEWEYAARAGSTSKYSWGDSPSGNYANGDEEDGWPSDGYNKKTASVGAFIANAFGLYDMTGNVWEWTEDCLNDSYNGAPSTGKAWLGGDCSRRVRRGGSWTSSPYNLRSARRYWDTATPRNPYSGFRLAQD